MRLELRDRYYDPYSQKFLSEDPIGFASGDLNFYRYVNNSPLTWVDPYGLTQKDIDVAFQIAFEKYPAAAMISYRIALEGEMPPEAVGRYVFKNNEILLSSKYLKELCDDEATDLLDTVFHEIGHGLAPILMYMDRISPGSGRKDFFHNIIYKSAARDTAQFRKKYLKQRKN